MDNRNNTIAGWVLFAGICALGLTIGSGMLFASHDPHKPGYPIEDAEGGEGGGASAVPLPNLLAAADVAKGEAVFAKCAACHTINQGGANGIGPNLYATMGEPIGQGKAGFAFRRYPDLWLGLGDPQGEEKARVAAVWRFRDLCDAAGVEPAFADIGPGMQRTYEDAGLTVVPMPDGRSIACIADRDPERVIALAETV